MATEPTTEERIKKLEERCTQLRDTHAKAAGQIEAWLIRLEKRLDNLETRVE